MELVKQLVANLKGINTRTYPLVMPENVTYPAIRYSVSTAEENFVDSNQLLQRYRVQIDLFAKTYKGTVDLRSQVQAAVRAMPEFIEQSIDIDGYETDTKVFRWTLDYTFRDLTHVA